jgi:hypothetical protein
LTLSQSWVFFLQITLLTLWQSCFFSSNNLIDTITKLFFYSNDPIDTITKLFEYNCVWIFVIVWRWWWTQSDVNTSHDPLGQAS